MKSTTPAKGKEFPKGSKMQNKTTHTASKASWSKQSSVLLTIIVKEVEQKILEKELLGGKENETTKWEYVAAFLHEASPSDAGKTPNNCQYKFWELIRHHKFVLKQIARKIVTEEDEDPVFLALRSYYGNSPPVEKKGRLQRRIRFFKESGNESEIQQNSESPLQLIGTPSPSAPIQHCDAIYESECDIGGDIGGSLSYSTDGESVGHLAASTQALEQSVDSAGSPLHHPNAEVPEQPQKPRAKRGRPKGKRKVSDLESLKSEEVKDKGASSNRLKQLVDKMARLTSYMKWKQTGTGEDWRCVLTDRIERRQKRGMRKLIKKPHQAETEETETQATDEIEAALREDILSCWEELDKKRPSPEECHEYLLKKLAGEVCW